MLQRIDVLVIPQIQEADYAAFHSPIKLLPSSYYAWRTYYGIALRKRGAGAVVQVEPIAKFKDYMQRGDPKPATLAELLRCATELASLEV